MKAQSTWTQEDRAKAARSHTSEQNRRAANVRWAKVRAARDASVDPPKRFTSSLDQLLEERSSSKNSKKRQSLLGGSTDASLDLDYEARRLLVMRGHNLIGEKPSPFQVAKAMKKLDSALREGATEADLLAIARWARGRQKCDRHPCYRALMWLWGMQWPVHLAAEQYEMRKYRARNPVPDTTGKEEQDAIDVYSDLRSMRDEERAVDQLGDRGSLAESSLREASS